MKTIFKSLIVLIIVLSLYPPAALRSNPALDRCPIQNPKPTEVTPQGQANDQGNDEAGYDSEPDLIGPVCEMNHILVVVGIQP